MKKLQIVRVDSDSVQKADLQVGDNIIGAGVVTECKDDRVPKHAITINVTPQGEMKISPLAPCYMKSPGNTGWTQLEVGSTVPIHVGDLFSLLSDKYWFKVISVDVNMEDDEPGLKRKLENGADEPSGKKLRPAESIEALLSPNGNFNDVPSSVGVDPGQEEFNPADYEEAATLSAEPVMDDIYGASVPEEGKTPDTTSSTKLEATGSTESTRSEEPNEEPPARLKITEVTTPQTTSAERIEDTTAEEPLGTDEAGKKIKWDCGQHFSDRTDQLAASSTSVPDIEQPAEPMVQNDGAPPATDTATASSPPPRNRCTYGIRCYRKNAEHKAQFSHPGDADYDVLDNRPECPYGIRCYRKNPQHRKDFKHTTQRRRRPQTPIRAKTPETTDQSSFEESIDESDYEPSWCTDSSDDGKSDWDDKEET